MKIKSIYIASFGGIKNLTLDLNDNFSVIYGQNEQGKTTVMSFIKMMFYGSDRAKGDLSKNPRKKYTPWDNSQMAGSIDYEKDGKSFRLERIFGESNSTDKVTLIDTDLGKREAVSSDVGTKVFGLSSAAFERSIFIGQFGFPESNSAAEGEIGAKLSNIALTGSEDDSFDAIYSRLEKAKLELSSKSGKSGIYVKNTVTLKDLNDRLNTALENQRKIEIGLKKADEILKEIEILKAKELTLKAQLQKEQDFKNADKLRELLSLKSELSDITKELTLSNGTEINDMFLTKIKFCLSKVNNINQKIDAKENENKIIKENLDFIMNPSGNATPEKAEEIKAKIDTLKKQQEELKRECAELENNDTLKPSPAFLILLILGVLLIASGAVLCLYYLFLGLATIAVGALAFLVSNIFKAKNSSKKNQNRIMEIRFKLNELLSAIGTQTDNLNAINTKLNSNSERLKKQQGIFENNLLEIENLSKEKAMHSAELEGLLGSTFSGMTDAERTEQIDSLTKKAATQKEIKQKINYILKDVGNISYEAAAEKIKEAEGFKLSGDFDQIKADYDNTVNLRIERSNLYATLTAEINAIKKIAKNPDVINAEIAALRLKCEAQKEYIDLLDLAMTVLSNSFSEVRRNYGSVLDNKATAIFKEITDGKYKKLNASKSFDISVEQSESFGSYEVGYLSNGTVDQAYLSLRLALNELMRDTNGSLPAMLDDSLTQFDDERTKAALKFLKKYSENNQIIMFTCHKSVSDTAEALGAGILNLQ